MSHIIFNTSACFSTYSTYSVVSFHLSPSCIFSVSLTFCLIQSKMTFFFFVSFFFYFSQNLTWNDKKREICIFCQSSLAPKKVMIYFPLSLTICPGRSLSVWVSHFSAGFWPCCLLSCEGKTSGGRRGLKDRPPTPSGLIRLKNVTLSLVTCTWVAAAFVNQCS